MSKTQSVNNFQVECKLVKPPTQWSEWCSRDKPSGNWDEERADKARSTCPDICEEPIAAECRVVGTEVPFDQTGDVFKVACTTEGLACKNDDQKDKKCEDYEVRYQCPPDRDECLDKTAECDENADCINTHGGYKCSCKKGFAGDGKNCYEGAKCTAWGDPHYITLNDVKYNFQGLCKYRLAEPCKDFGGVPDFNVISKNTPFVKKEGIALTKFVEVKVYGLFIVLQGKSVLVNEQEVTPPQRYDPASKEWPGSYLAIVNKKRGVTITTDFGLIVDYDGRSRVEITVPKTFQTHMCGMCGNYDGDPKDEFILPDGTIVEDANDFADAWAIKDDDPKCKAKTPEEAKCSDEALDKSRQRCSIISDESGPFAECLVGFEGDVSQYVESCVFDICVVPENDDLYCPAVEAFAAACESAKFSPKWRTPNRCPLKCGLNMHFEADGTACEATCADVNAPANCPDTPLESCQCDANYVKSGEVCVPLTDCGCTVNNKYYKINDQWFEDGCTARCTCLDPGETECDNTVQCHENGECYTLDDGTNSCRCKAGFKGEGLEDCSDEDECSANTHKCDDNARCVNAHGGYECVCKAGFTGDGFDCEDVDECEDGKDQCSPSADCVNEVGTYTCACKQGFKGDGRTCEEEKPEEPEKPVKCSVFQEELCVESADCVLMPDEYSACVCPEGAMGDGMKGDDYTGCRVPSCPVGMVKHDDGCFSFNDVAKPFKEARKDCEAQGGDLAAIFDEATMEFVREQMIFLGLTGHYWIGYTDEKMDGIYTWVDDTGSDYNNWAEGEPNPLGSAIRDCVAISDSSEFKFTSHPCGISTGFVCRKPLELKPCPKGWEMYEGECYYMSQEKRTYIESYLRCMVHGAHLTSVLSMEEEDFIGDSLMLDVENMSWWTGITQALMSTDAQFVWSDGSPTEYLNWAENEPLEESKEKCVAIGPDLTWNAMNCASKMGLICKRNEQVKEKCPEGSVRIGKNCVKAVPKPETRSDAEEDCRKMGGGLVSIHSQFEQDVIGRYLDSQSIEFNSWIGLQERGVNNEYSWSDKTELNYLYWGEKQPNDDADSKNCVLMVKKDNYKWNDQKCDQPQLYLCEYRNTPCRSADTCHDNAQCSFGQCRCKKGFMGDGKDACNDVDECEEGDPCPTGARCVNEEGRYKCECGSGFVRSGDQCLSLTKCKTDADCNTLGECVEDNCQCQEGYMGDGKQLCEDVNECDEETDECNPNADCKNKRGGYDCVCKDGYMGDGIACKELPRNCDDLRLQDPELTSGSYKVDPDGPGGLSPLTVTCIVRPDIGITVIPTDSQRPTAVLSEEVEKKPVKYRLPLNLLLPLIDESEFCYQNILYSCKNGAKLQGIGSWIGRDDKATTLDECFCGMLDTCATPGSKCNCDGTPMGDQVDEIKIVDKTKLPILSLDVGGVKKGQKATVAVGPLVCGPKQFDIPRDCDDAMRNYGQKKNGPVLIDVDGPEGELAPIVADCDVTSYPSTGVTIIPNKLPEDKKPEKAGEVPVEYPVSPEVLKKLIESSKFCSQEMSYTCTNSGLMGGNSFWSGLDKAKKKYWAGGLGQEKMCGCGVTKSCEDAKVNCNCDIKDGKERKDFGLIINKADLPVASVTLDEIGGDKKGSLSVGSLMCGQNQFGIKPTCQQYREMGYLDDYTYLIDPDGPPRRGDEPAPETELADGVNVAPFPVICEMIEDKPVGITTVGHDSEKPTKVDDAEEPGSYTKPVTYIEAIPEQLAALADHSAYCTQEMAYKCKQAVIHNIDDPKNPVAYWIGRDGQKNQYFAGVEGSMCQCGIEGNCEGENVVCNCDANLDKEVVDKGFLANKDDLPVLQLAFGDTGDDNKDSGEHTLGKLRCYEVFETCYHMQEFYRKRPNTKLPPNGRYMIDPDGPLGEDPFEVYCHFPKTIVDIEVGNQFLLPDAPDNLGPAAQCVKPHYVNANKEQLQALTEKSGFCRQYGKFTCQHAPFTKNAFWKSRDGEKQKGWAGNAGGDKCACGEVGKCDSGEACNCDANDGKLREDHGLFIDKELLPVSEICFGLSKDDVPDSEKRFAEYFLGSLECSSAQFGIPKDCQRLRNSKTPGEQIISEPWLIDPDQLGNLPPFPVYCEMLKDIPVGVTVVEPETDKEEDVPAAGKDIPVGYKSTTTDQLAALADVSEYCTQEMSYKCKDAALKLGDGFGAYSREGQLLPYWAGNSGGKDGCKGGTCQCGKTDGKEYTDGGSLLDKKVLPVSRVNIAASEKGTRKLKVEDLRCFALFKTCHEIKLAGQERNPNWDGRYGIDPDSAGGVEPFGVDCDFKTNPEIGITEIPTDVKEDIPVGVKPLEQPVKYFKVSPEQANQLAQVSEFCLQGMKYKCKKAAFMGAGGSFLTFDGKESTKFAGADNGEKDGCACMVLGTCPYKKQCRCDAVGPMEAEEGDFVTNRDLLPVTGVKSDGVSGDGAEASFSVGNLRCGPQPFDLPEDCQQALDWGYRTGEALIWPSRDVKPFLVFCDMDSNPGIGVTVVPTAVEEEPVIGVTKVAVKYDGASPEQIKALVDESDKCLLPMKYECTATKFSSAFSIATSEKEDVSFFAGGLMSGMCNCGDQKRCGGEDGRRQMELRNCNCDVGDTKWRKDAGIFGRQGEMPVTAINFESQGGVTAKGKLTLGSLYCTDKPIDLDECEMGFNDCHDKAKCINRNGYYQCVCQEGYRGRGNLDVWANGRECYDDDECALGMCPDNSECKNVPGKYSCTCNEGYEEDKDGNCVDIDECTKGTHTCDKKAECSNNEGSYKCTCKLGAVGDGFKCEVSGTCKVGGPHVTTFDRKKIDFASACLYTLARDSCADINALGKPAFEVQGRFSSRNQAMVDRGTVWLEDLYVKIGEVTVGFTRDGVVTQNGVLIKLPAVVTKGVNVFRSGNKVRLVSRDLGLEVIFNRGSMVRIKLNEKNKGKVCGICGNYNDKLDDDLAVGPLCDQVASNQNVNSVTSSWIVEEPKNEQCEKLCDIAPPEPCLTDEDGTEADSICENMINVQLVGEYEQFQECIDLMTGTGVDIVAEYLETCTFDTCASLPEVKATLCEVAQRFTTECFEQTRVKVDISRWRMENGCVDKCGANMVYKSCGSACPETCSDPLDQLLCPAVCVEGCFCAEGFVMDDNKCVKKKDCGCVMDDKYYSKGDSFVKSGCTEVCECQRNGKMDCKPIKCDANAVCAVEDFINNCYCKEGFAGDGVHCTDINECVKDPESCDKNAECQNTDGSFTCKCNEGFEGDGSSCENVNECIRGTDNCDDNAECRDDEGSFKCVCKEGFKMNREKNVCEDVDECLSGRHDCDRLSTVCENTPGDFVCTCLEGLERVNRKECQDIDECELKLDKCDENAECGNRIGEYSCTCNLGYNGDGFTCKDVDECTDYKKPCKINQVCKNIVGSYECECDKGFVMTDEGCEDVDECEKDTHDCKAENSECKNNIGSYACECKPGYQGDGKTKCEDINECTQPGPPVCGTNSKCENKDGYSDSFTCTCKKGFVSPAADNRNCNDQNECTDGTNDCHEKAVCDNIESSFTCTCQKGYDGDGKTCKDINECEVTKDICGPNANCTNEPGSYSCECLKGFAMGEQFCENIDECAKPELNDCDNKARCTDLDATFLCQCFVGYAGSGKQGDCTQIDECKEKTDTCTDTQDCNDLNPGFECICKDGYEPIGSDCKDIDECANEDDDCDKNAECVNTEPGFTCNCLTGFVGNGQKCDDVNECEKTCKGEGQKCTNTPGSYNCECTSGYKSLPDGTCKDVDECASKPGPCSENMECKNTPGAYECTCVEGYAMADGNKQTCEDEDECKREEGSPCAIDQTCTNTVGGYSCTCQPGYEMEDKTCKDIDECSNPLTCNGNAKCDNTEGSFTCTCKEGFTGDGITCEDVNECKEKTAECSPNGDCRNTPGSYECNSCKSGFQGNGKECEDVNECDTNHGGCDKNAECENYEGAFECNCRDGYTGDGQTCTDKDECTENTHGCPPYSDCKNTEGGFDCICKTGYVMEFEECVDINECTQPDSCGNYAQCSNTDGSYECSCLEFFEMHTDGKTCLAPNDCTYDSTRCRPDTSCLPVTDGSRCFCNDGFREEFMECIDIDECLETPRICGKGKQCANNYGGFDCFCIDGYKMNDKEECVDTDECEEGLNMCDVSAKCVNSDGSYECTCGKGYVKVTDESGLTSCLDINECDEDTDGCDVNADCLNNEGSYTCECKRGFKGDGKSCKDIDECSGENGCSDKAKCIDRIGTYSCECVAGYMGDGFTCTDVDECVNGDHDCAKNADCVNIDGGFQCACKTGYTGHCDACEDVDECATGLAECDENAACYNLEGTYSCDCPKGYQMVFKYCVDVNECLLGIDECGRNGDCTNTDGGYECVCHLGYAKDEDAFCSDVDECASNGQICDENAGCYNTEGSYICICNPGFEGDGETCKELHPSDCGGQVCHPTASCKNNVCTCPPGARGEAVFGTDGCTDIDECSEGSHDCDPNANCRNIAGSFTCFCKQGFVGDGTTCDDASPQGCDSPTACGEHATCHDNGDGTYYCECGEGFDSISEFECVDINECDDWFTCLDDQVCYDTPGSFECICTSGFKYDVDSDYCADIDECETGLHDCDVRSDGSGNAICTNHVPGYSCECKPGHSGDGVICTEENEPGCGKECGPGQYCINAGDDTKCVCQSGFKPKDDGSCVAIDRCPDLCDKNAACDYDPASGSHCSCNPGYRGNGRYCENMNECAESMSECSEEARCEDTIGSYKCVCPPGYSGDGFTCEFGSPTDDNCGCGEKGVCADTLMRICECDDGYEFVSSKKEHRCTDVDECSRNGACHPLARCANLPGSHSCQCNPGTVGDGLNFCNEEECNSNPCSPDAKCANVLGGHTCNCNEGYEGDGVTCLPIGSPCQKNNGECGPNAMCTTGEEMGVLCVCKAGFEGDGGSCLDVNECEGEHDCSPQATCRNFDGGFTCSCNKGFYGDGKTCENINECEMNIADCSANSRCQDMEGGFMCECFKGFDGDGKTCGRDSGCLTSDICDSNAKCLLRNNTYQCICDYGYTGDGKICTNVNAGECADVNGELVCECSPGYSPVDGLCKDVDDCAERSLNNCEEDSECRNYDGGFECICADGKPGKNGHCGAESEDDVDECAGNNNCHRYATCHNTPGAYYCTCVSGYTGSGFDCADINECEMGTADCGANTQCYNLMGSYTCGCLAGFDWDGAACVDIDECGEGYDNDCSDFADCKNNDGSYTCACSSGYKGNGKVCLKVNPCDEPGVCHPHAVCTNEVSTAVCTCRPGFKGNGKDCTKVDACKTGTHNCHPNADCKNKEDGFTCTCKKGFNGDGINACDDNNECDPNTPNGGGHQCDPSNSGCLNKDGGYECVCKFGFEKNGEHTCKGYNVCERDEDDCSDNAKCDSVPGGFVCSCKEGFDGNGKQCSDIDECATGNFNCPSLTECVNRDGSYKCECKEGYKQEGETCVDIDECTSGEAKCGDKAKCTNTKGAYACVCDEGYSATPSGCVDADECGTNTDNCHKNANCENTIGSFTCSCKEGFKKDGNLCVEIDKCAEGAVKCGDNAMCVPTGEKPHCQCRSGFEGNPDTGCTDIDDCAGGNDCSSNAKCNNEVGSYSCECKEGFRGNGKVCADIDECFEGKDDCSEMAVCYNTVGRFTCSCNSGYMGNGKTCKQVDECTANPNICGANEKCKDTEGSYLCLCVDGYRKNSAGNCQDIDECAEGLATCHVYAADCIDVDGSYECKCKKGFEGDGRNCKDIDECETKTIDCHEHATCTNIEGGATCSCKAGFDGNGLTCFDVDECTKGKPCGNSATCGNVIGSYVCTCLPGFRKQDGGTCEDINECVETPTVCPDKAACSNSRGSYQCVCPKGYESAKEGKECKKIDPCLVNNCSPDADCTEEEDLSYSCKCRDGFSGDGEHCTDDDECAKALEVGTDVCHGDKCVNTHGGYSCVCQEGYELKGGVCKNIDECSLPPTFANAARCSEAEVCVDTTGSYKCDCKAGYQKEGEECVNIDECLEGNRCHPNAQCIDNVGSYTCECQKGYAGNGRSCVDIDECSMNPVMCGDPSFSNCRNTGGSYTCICGDGYTARNGVCEDINECDLRLADCGKLGRCLNVNGGYHCECPQGFDFNHGECKDVDECAFGTDNCDVNAVCENKDGSYVCTCRPGFTGDGRTCAKTCGDTTCPGGQACTVDKKGKPSCSCKCEGKRCKRHGKVCGTDGMDYSSEKDLVIAACDLGQDIQVDYRGKCKRTCDDMRCPRHKECTLNKAGKPNCRCRVCTKEEEESGVVCTDKYQQFLSICHFTQFQCNQDPDDDQVITTMGECPERVDCVVSDWAPWQPCSVKCGNGKIKRTREITQDKIGDGAACPPTEESGNCYEPPCAESPCASKVCEGPGQVCVMRGKEPVCECPDCAGLGDQPVCGMYSNGTKTVKNKCTLDRDACILKQSVYLLYPNKCGAETPNQPLNCSVVPHFGHVSTTTGCETTKKQAVNKCSGGCGSDAGLCCEPSEFREVFAEVKCAKGEVKREKVPLIKECKCVPKKGEKPMPKAEPKPEAMPKPEVENMVVS